MHEPLRFVSERDTHAAYGKRLHVAGQELTSKLDGLYREIYARKNRDYWTELDAQIRAYCEREGMTYLRDDGDQHRSAFGEPPIVCNYFYHEEVRKSAKAKAR